ncbi:hypothetical protein ACFL2T_00580 [Elusimicrobiota bacterium]
MTAFDPEEVKRRLNELITDDPSKIALRITSAKKDHARLCFAQWEAFIKYFEDAFEVVVLATHELNKVKKDDWGWPKIAQFICYPIVQKTLTRAFNDVTDGFPDESLMLSRSVYENILRMGFMSCYPNDWEAAWGDIAGKPKFNATNFPRDNLKLEWGIFYRITSYAAHGNKHEVLGMVRKVVEQKAGWINLKIPYDEERTSSAINYLIFLLWVLIRLFPTFFPEYKTDDAFSTELRDRLQKADDAFEVLVAGSPNRFGQTIPEVQKFVQIVKAANDGEDWKDLAKRLSEAKS